VTTTAPPTPAPGPAPDPVAGRGWWRRNRWALVALPLALVLVLAASADRVRTLWWEQGLHRPTVGAPGETVTFSQRVRDGLGGTSPVEVRVRLDGIGEPAELPRDLVVPDGARAVQVDLTLWADPDVILAGCSLAVRDAAGTRYDYVPNAWGAFQAVSPCVPEDAPGPMPSLGVLDDPDADPGPTRPGTWTVSPVVVLPADVEPTEVALWWQLPQHVLLGAGG